MAYYQRNQPAVNPYTLMAAGVSPGMAAQGMGMPSNANIAALQNRYNTAFNPASLLRGPAMNPAITPNMPSQGYATTQPLSSVQQGFPFSPPAMTGPAPLGESMPTSFSGMGMGSTAPQIREGSGMPTTSVQNARREATIGPQNAPNDYGQRMLAQLIAKMGGGQV